MNFQVDDDSWFWHQRFDHFITQALKLLYQKNMMRGLANLKENNEAYEGCFWGKQHRLPFSTNKSMERKRLVRVSLHRHL